MPVNLRIGTRIGRASAVNLENWPGVDPDALPEERRSQYLMRRKAIEMYLAGASDADLRESTGIPRSNVYRMIADRCLMQHPDGTLVGEGALPRRLDHLGIR